MHGTVVSRRIVICLAILIGVAIPLRGLDLVSTQRVFAGFAAAKRLTLPLAYLAFIAAALLPSRLRREEPPVRLPAWLVMPAIGITIGLVGAVFIPATRSTTSDVLQGLALFLGFTLFAWFGLGATEWTSSQQNVVLWLLLTAGAIAGAVGASGLTPFMALTVPGFFAAVVMVLRSPGRRARFLLAAAVLGALLAWQLSSSGSPNVPASGAVIGQTVACGFVVLLLLVPRGFRPPLIFIAVSAALIFFIQRGYYTLLTGQYQTADVTIAQRVFEARAVIEQLDATDLGMLFGLGPGATVDLSASPDAGTLAASGRDLLAVDDVHLLSAYLLLKLGAFGIVWSLLLFGAAWKAALPAFGPSSADTTWRLLLLLYVVAGAVNALPAATNLFVNPLVPIFLGALWALRDRDRRQTGVSTVNSAAVLRPVG